MAASTFASDPCRSRRMVEKAEGYCAGGSVGEIGAENNQCSRTE